MRHRVVRRPRARRDIIEQALFIGRDQPEAAERFQDAVEQAEQMLADMLAIGAPRPIGRFKDLRVWRVHGFDRHLIFYRPIVGGIDVIRLLHGSRDIAAVLEQEAGA
jgi:toxin ParE1/3/4